MRETVQNAVAEGVDLRCADLSYADLRNVNFSGVNLSYVDFSSAYLSYANLSYVNLTRADFTSADLRGVRFIGATLTDAIYDTNVPMSYPPVAVTGLRWNVMILDQHMEIGCELHSHDGWAEFTDSKILTMAGRKALEFWLEHRITLLALCRSHAAECEKLTQAGVK